MDLLNLYQPYMISVFRIITGLIFMEHGTQKLFGFPAKAERGMPELFSLSGIGGVMEFVGGLLVVIGLFTRPVAFFCQARWRRTAMRWPMPRPAPVISAALPARCSIIFPTK
jgi:uncharacterized membrane protein YphA (DoxX/SURF4 family)